MANVIHTVHVYMDTDKSTPIHFVADIVYFL